jgi:hypothetical protein
MLTSTFSASAIALDAGAASLWVGASLAVSGETGASAVGSAIRRFSFAVVRPNRLAIPQPASPT